MNKPGPLLRGLLISAGLAGNVACYPLTIDDAAEADIVVTRKAENYDYGKNRTYDIPEQVADLCEQEIPINDRGDGGAGGDGALDADEIADCVDGAHAYDDEILEAVKRNLEAAGYVRVAADGSEVPDVMVNVGTIVSNNYVVYYYPWWGYYPYYYGGWYGDYWGWWGYYPYYPPTTVVNYPTGTLLIQMLSIKDADPVNERIPGIWTAAVKVLLEASDEVTATTRINSHIDQAFAQSSYLKVSR